MVTTRNIGKYIVIDGVGSLIHSNTKSALEDYKLKSYESPILVKIVAIYNKPLVGNWVFDEESKENITYTSLFYKDGSVNKNELNVALKTYAVEIVFTNKDGLVQTRQCVADNRKFQLGHSGIYKAPDYTTSNFIRVFDIENEHWITIYYNRIINLNVLRPQ
jgi:hypothetical protein